MANELTDREYLGIIRGEIVWNHRTERWEKKPAQDFIPWWKMGVAYEESHLSSALALSKQLPTSHESLPDHEWPGGLTHDQLIRIHQLNDLASREVITEYLEWHR